MDESGDERADDGRHPEEPELLERPAADEKRRPVLRAGFTEVLVTGMLIRWMSVSARPIARPANPTGARLWVVPRMTIRNMNVITTLANQPASKAVLARRMLAVAVRRESASETEVRLAARDQIEHRGAGDSAHDLRDRRSPAAATGKRPPAHKPTETAGLKWPPEIGPSA